MLGYSEVLDIALKVRENENVFEDYFDELYEYYFLKGDMPYGVAKGRTGDPYTWVADRLEEVLKEEGYE